MAIISKKKIIYPIYDKLQLYCAEHGRQADLPITYEDLCRYNSSIPLFDNNDNDTLWETVFFSPIEMEQVHASLKYIYSLLRAGGDVSVIKHLYIDRIDVCTYGNTRPFRIRVVNRINDLFDYFYIKRADASRVYGLELEHLLSPNNITFFVNDQTLVEEHIQGIPGDQFMAGHMHSQEVNEIRLAKEFVKFNERCFVRLLGDMHANNFVVEIIPDFDEVHYRIRPIDFDQQNYEGRRVIYLPQFFKQNNPIIQIGIKYMKPELELQYQKEERSRLRNRIRAAHYKIDQLIEVMKGDNISKPTNVHQLKTELSEMYRSSSFLKCQNMGEVLHESLSMLFKQKIRPRNNSIPIIE
ncbi:MULTISPECIES: hypothetical protein [Persicobacter]|uniref:Uncharacterized protein n=1 Tax=Persicobacter diffluens TaxID=981 RepID=A0AAN4VVA3_9BACT|nr:hypothetical protein [Persicobacter sp. CCB-QB2]GJM59642.1 hypothetical protein PEDI_01940 [Persicobacter diffluens]